MVRFDSLNPDGTQDIWVSSCCQSDIVFIDEDTCCNCGRELPGEDDAVLLENINQVEAESLGLEF